MSVRADVLRPGSRRARMVAMIAGGVSTSRELANALGLPIAKIAPEMSALEGRGLVVRCRPQDGARGRPCVRWRVMEGSL